MIVDQGMKMRRFLTVALTASLLCGAGIAQDINILVYKPKPTTTAPAPPKPPVAPKSPATPRAPPSVRPQTTRSTPHKSVAPKAPVPPKPPAQQPVPDTVAVDLQDIGLVTVSADGSTAPGLADATRAFQTGLSRDPTGKATPDEKTFLHNLAGWSRNSPDLVQHFADIGPTGFALMMQVFRNADATSSQLLVQDAELPVLADTSASWAMLCRGVNSGAVAITGTFGSDGERLGWILATRAACEARSAVLAAGITGPGSDAISDAGVTTKCADFVSGILPNTSDTVAADPQSVIDGVTPRYLAELAGSAGTDPMALAKDCLLTGLYRDDAGQILASALVLSAQGAESYDLLIATQMRWGIGVPADTGHAAEWLKRGVAAQGDRLALPQVVRDWAAVSLQAIGG